MQAGLNALQGQPINDWKNYDAHVTAVKVERLAGFASRWFTPAQRTQLVVRP
jgi:zinc protease